MVEPLIHTNSVFEGPEIVMNPFMFVKIIGYICVKNKFVLDPIDLIMNGGLLNEFSSDRFWKFTFINFLNCI